jgi:hypothetical protein
MSRKNSKTTELYLGSGANLELVSTKVLSTTDNLILYGPSGDNYELQIKIEGDLSNIPEEYHQAFLNMFSAKYLGRVSYTENILTDHDNPPKRKWYEFWKIIKLSF